MNNIIKSTGESSCKGRENGDASIGSDRPLKKARFAWQVKGKYHMKNEAEESNKSLTMPSTEPGSLGESSSGQSSAHLGSEPEHYLGTRDYCKLNSFIHPDNSFLTHNDSISNDHQQYPRYMSSHERKSNNMLGNAFNMRTVSIADNAEDQCIAQWQAGQVAKSCLDNTLNQILESWTSDPFPAAEANPNRFFALNFAEFINHLPGDNSVENEGILMAISAHGLQNTSSNSSNNVSNEGHCSTSSHHAHDNCSGLNTTSPVISDDDSQTTDQHFETAEHTLTNIDWQCDNQNANDATPFAYFSEPSPSTYDFYDDSHQNSNTDSLEIDNHYDFMDAAVLYAIQSKGLTASGTEYG